ncbi:MAG: M23 family metallopeptidase [Oscillatoriales cyanobacterium]|nr:MAG: M23 family metallopeptidase [Oscillatoriales cyanobacterium]
MKRRIPEYYTLWLGRTGQDPWVLQFKPIWLTRAAIAIATIGTTVIGGLAYQRSTLQARQAELNRQAEQVIEQIEALERDLDELRRRSGTSEEETMSSGDPQPDQGRGGAIATDIPTLEADTRDKLRNAQQLALYLKRQLSTDVRPALEATLAYEAAIPNRKPIGETSEMTSTFGKRANPFGFGGSEFHNGLDFIDEYGAPILATAPGTVIEAGYNGGYGNQITLQHAHGYQTLYAHLSEIEVEVGDRVERGEIIGALGNTGRSTGPHLHYEVHLDRQPLNPQNFLAPRETPIADTRHPSDLDPSH